MFKDPRRCSKIRADVQRSAQMFKDPRSGAILRRPKGECPEFCVSEFPD
jgi:hypothetical protein